MQVSLSQIVSNPGVFIGAKDWTSKTKKTCKALEKCLKTHRFFGQDDYNNLVSLRLKVAKVLSKPGLFSSKKKREILSQTIKTIDSHIRTSHPLLRLPNDVLRLIIERALQTLADGRNFSKVCWVFHRLAKVQLPTLAAKEMYDDQLYSFCYRLPATRLTLYADQSKLIQQE